MPTSSTAQARSSLLSICSLLSKPPSTVTGKQVLEPEKFRWKSGQELDFNWKEQKRNEQWIRRPAKEEIRQRKRSLEWKRGREIETWQWDLHA